MTIFQGLSAFPLTPADEDGRVDTDALSVLVDRIAQAGVDSIGLLGSTGTYAYLDRSERSRAVAAAIEAVAGRVPVIVGVGAMRTSWSVELARNADKAGADGLLLAPVSYTPLRSSEVSAHFKEVASATALPLCIYNNPDTTNFTFSDSLLLDLSRVENIAAVKLPLPADGAYKSELARLRNGADENFRIGYSGDWGAAPSLLAGADTFYCVVAGLLPAEMLTLARAAQAGRTDETARIDAAFQPLWDIFKAHGSLRTMYALADSLSLNVGKPPRPLQRLDPDLADRVGPCLDKIRNLIL